MLTALLWGCKSNHNPGGDRWDVGGEADADTMVADTRAEDTAVEDTRDTEDAVEDTGPYVGGQQDDPDEDGVININDNCKLTANPDQLDQDRDGVGDACDNCAIEANADQQEVDCEPLCPSTTIDTDGDGLIDSRDNCPRTSNVEQADADADTRGDVCDNCPEEGNYAQQDTDSDGIGDACESSPAEAGDIDFCYHVTETRDAPTPNIYFLLDASAEASRSGAFGMFSAALDKTAADISTMANVGVATFGSSQCTSTEQLAMGGHSAADISSSYAGVQPAGERPLVAALASVSTNDSYALPSDPHAASRRQSVVLLISGHDDSCGNHNDTVWAVDALHAEGIRVYVVGATQRVDTAKLDAIAQAGGTSHYEANTEAELYRALREITWNELQCFHQASPNANMDGSKAWVSVDGQHLEQDADDGFSYRAGAMKYVFSPAACQQVVAGEPDAPVEVEYWLGCTTTCIPDSEEDACIDADQCDGIDNDCDGEIDEHCPDLSCTPEVCDGTDTDCDGRTDEGCPTCTRNGESCESSADCCSDVCAGGTCVRQCSEAGRACREDGECCGGVECYSGDGESGFCLAD